MGKYSDQLEKLKANLDKQKRPDMLIAFLRAIFVAFLAFTFLSGLIFTVAPLMRNIYLHVIWNFFEPINQWVAEEPVTGNAILFLFKAAGVVLVLYLLRSYLMFIPTYIMAAMESDKPKKTVKIANKAVPARKPVQSSSRPKDVLKAPPG